MANFLLRAVGDSVVKQDQTNLLDPKNLAQIEGLQLRATKIVEGYVSGLHRSPFHGFSVEFAEHREYVPGDDLRYVDWKVLGKSDRVYLKQYEEETNLIAYLVLDVSESMQYQSEGAPLSKLGYAQTAAASLAYLVLRQQDSASLATFDESVKQYLRPSSSPSSFKQMLEVMQETSAVGKTRTGPIFHELAERLTRRGVVIILSDLFDDPEAIIAGLKHLRHRRHDVIVMHVLDPAELDFPFNHATLFKGLEDLGELLAEPAQLRRAYREEIEQFTITLRSGCLAMDADYVQLRTDQSLGFVLSHYLARRGKRTK